MKIHTFYKLFPKLLTSYVNVHIVFIFNFILSYSPKVLVRCRLGCLTCIATQKLNNFSHLFSPDPPSPSPRFSSSVHLLLSFMACVVGTILSVRTHFCWSLALSASIFPLASPPSVSIYPPPPASLCLLTRSADLSSLI